jgi:CheY-like chemotaxis protein
MNIVYADDDQLSLQIVLRALEARGHQVTTIDSSKVNDMLKIFRQLLANGPLPQLIILDGHNVARDADGTPLVDVQPTMLLNWFQRNGLPGDTRFVLYSSDDQLIEQARSNTALGFAGAVSKVGTEGGLYALLDTVERVQ